MLGQTQTPPAEMPCYISHDISGAVQKSCLHQNSYALCVDPLCKAEWQAGIGVANCGRNCTFLNPCFHRKRRVFRVRFLQQLAIDSGTNSRVKWYQN